MEGNTNDVNAVNNGVATETNTVNTEPTTANVPEKTFTQADVDALIQKRLDRERKKYPSEEELTAFKSWKDSQQTEKEKMEGLEKERDEAKSALSEANAEIEQMKREKFLVSKGVSTDDLDYYVFKIGKLVTEDKTFEEAAEDFLKDRKKEPQNKGVSVDMGAPLTGGKSMTKEEILAIKDPAERQRKIAENLPLFGA